MKYFLLLALLAGIAFAEDTEKNEGSETDDETPHGRRTLPMFPGMGGNHQYQHPDPHHYGGYEQQQYQQHGYGYGYGYHRCPAMESGNKCIPFKGRIPKSPQMCTTKSCTYMPQYGYDENYRPTRILPYGKGVHAVVCAQPNTPCQCNSRTTCSCSRKAKICRQRWGRIYGSFSVVTYEHPKASPYGYARADSEGTQPSQQAPPSTPEQASTSTSQTTDNTDIALDRSLPIYPDGYQYAHQAHKDYYPQQYGPPQYVPHPPMGGHPYGPQPPMGDPKYGQYPPMGDPKYEPYTPMGGHPYGPPPPMGDLKYEHYPQQHPTFDPKYYNDPNHPYDSYPGQYPPQHGYGNQTPNPMYGGYWHQPQMVPVVKHNVQLSVTVPYGCYCS